MYGVSSLMPPCLQKAWHGDVTMFAGSMLGQYFTYGVLKKNEKDSWRENTACCLHRKRRNKQYLIIWEKTDHINSIHCFIEAIILDLMQERKFLSLQASFFQSWRTWEDLGFFFFFKISGIPKHMQLSTSPTSPMWLGRYTVLKEIMWVFLLGCLWRKNCPSVGFIKVLWQLKTCGVGKRNLPFLGCKCTSHLIYIFLA